MGHAGRRAWRKTRFQYDCCSKLKDTYGTPLTTTGTDTKIHMDIREDGECSCLRAVCDFGGGAVARSWCACGSHPPNASKMTPTIPPRTGAGAGPGTGGTEVLYHCTCRFVSRAKLGSFWLWCHLTLLLSPSAHAASSYCAEAPCPSRAAPSANFVGQRDAHGAGR